MIKKTILSMVLSLAVANSAVAVENKVYATVNGDKITSQSIAIALKDPKVKFDSLPKDTQKNILDRIIEQKLLSQKAMKTDVVNDKMYKETLESLKQDLALQVWMQQLSKEIKISQKELKSFYDKNKKLFKVGEQLKARHILVADEKTAKDLIKVLKSSKNLKSKFISLAKEKSTGPSGANGGDLGWFPLEKMVPEFSKAASELKVGTASLTPVKTQFGYHIIYLEDKKKATTATFENAQLQISQKLGREKFIAEIQSIVDGLKKKAKIVYK
ncbi:MAG: peptidylprolyl isomerase [Arcobacteraceae bacterium]|nr:peptidylprolyl isomerase [Arcobacteraceae bacterium]